MEHGIPEAIADQLGCAIADHLAESWGGQNFTIPKDHANRLSNRDLEIYQNLTGRNHHILAKRYNLSVRAIYKIVKRIQAKGNPNQPTLL